MKFWMGALIIMGIIVLAPMLLIVWFVLKALGDADSMVEAMMREEETMETGGDNNEQD